MDSLLGTTSTQGISDLSSITSSLQAQYSLNATVVEKTLRNAPDTSSSSSDYVSFDFTELYKGLSITNQGIIDKLNELLKGKLPDGIQSLKPDEVTPEATADRIVKGSTAFFDIYAKQNPDLEGEELVNSFLETIKGGIQTGYDDAYGTLVSLGAFDVDGVKNGIEQTKTLIESKLQAYEKDLRQRLGIDPTDVATTVAQDTKNALLASAGARTLNITA